MALDSAQDLTCVGTTSTPSGCVELVRTYHPDVIVIDYQLIGFNGFECVQTLKNQGLGCPVIMLTAFASPDIRTRALAEGANGVLAKDVSLQELFAAIRTVAAGCSLHDQPGVDSRVTLSDRQREVLTLMGRGCDPAAIAEQLFISIHTARGHVKTVMKLMNASSQLEAVTNAMQTGYLIVDRPDIDAEVASPDATVYLA